MASHGGCASLDNLNKAKPRELDVVVHHQKRGLHIEDTVRSSWVDSKLRNFGAGIAAAISVMNRAHGLGRWAGKGSERLRANVWSSVIAHNVALFGR